MGRRTSSGRIGAPTFGGLLADAETITSDDNRDIIIDPTGTGRVLIDAVLSLQNRSNLRFVDSDQGNYTAFQPPASLTANTVFTLPDGDGTNGAVLSTDGNGTLSWVASGLAVENTTADSNTNYVYFSTVTSGQTSTLRTTDTKLTFIPSTGALSATLFDGPSAEVNIQADNSTDSTYYPLFSDVVSGSDTPRTDSGYTYNPNSGELTATLLTASSDERLKSDIVTIEDALDKVTALRGVDFTRIESGLQETGVIAQEVEKILPNAVTTRDDGFKSVAYGNMVGILIEAIKELNEKIDTLTKESGE